MAFVSSISFKPTSPLSSLTSSKFCPTHNLNNRSHHRSSHHLQSQPNFPFHFTTTIRQTLTQPPTETNSPSPSSPSSSSPHEETDLLIIGGGISGTSLAYTLYRDHPDVSFILTESRDVIGGNVISKQRDGYTWEEGPNTFQPAEHIMRLIVDVGLKDDLVLADSTLPRFVYWNNELFALPLSPKDLPTFRLLSTWGLIRAGFGAMGFIWPNYNGKNTESIKDFITRHLGSEVFKKMIDPFVSGVYAGDPSKLCMSAAFKKIFALQNLGGTQGIIEGAIIRILQKKKEAKQNPMDKDLPSWKPGALGSFRNGLSTLPKTIMKKINEQNENTIRTNWHLKSLNKLDDMKYEAIYETDLNEENKMKREKRIIAKSIAITTPARAASSILSNITDENIRQLENIHYPTVWSISLAYPTSEFKQPLKGFGNLIPRSMGIRTLGTIWSSCLFPGRAPEGMELLLSYIGGAQDVDISKLSEEEVIATVDKDIKKILLREGSDVKPVVVGARKWDRAIPQYNIGYWEIIEKMEQSLKQNECDGIFMGGNYTSGVAFGDCVLWGSENGSKIANYIVKERQRQQQQQQQNAV